MNQEQILTWAREAGALVFQSNFCGSSFDFNPEQLERFSALVAAHEREKLMNVAIFSKWYQELDAAVLAEREACAKVCEENGEGWADGNNDWCSGQVKGSYDCAAAIRARSDK